MKLVKRFSKKHKGCVFLKDWENARFVIKVYAVPGAEAIANRIIAELKKEIT